jgi:epoxyqueuosine reductase
MRSEQGRFREELRLIADPPAAAALAREAGFDRAAIVDPRLLAPWAQRLTELRRRGLLATETAGGCAWEWILSPETWAVHSTILVCCLSCFRREPDDLSTPGDPHALIAPFARAHYYRTAVHMLRAFGLRLEAALGVPRLSLRFFSNSRIPEKPLLAASALGTYGRNGLALVPGLGSMFIIAGAVIPLPSAASGSPEPPAAADPCGSCRRCMEACPVGAIREPGVVDPGRCLQGAAASVSILDPEVMSAWGARLYGCQECQNACPHNRSLTEVAGTASGEIGPSVPLREVLGADGAALARRLRGTAMGMSWISPEALLRNALVAAGNRGDPSLRSAVQRFSASEVPALREAARWALERLPG